MGLMAACQPTTVVSGSESVSWVRVAPETTTEIVQTSDNPDPYQCWFGDGTGSLVQGGFAVPGDCNAHFAGHGFSVAVPQACVDALQNSFYDQSAAGPLLVRVRDDASGSLLGQIANAWEMPKPSNPIGLAQQVMLPANLCFATSGSGILTSGYRNSDVVSPANDIRSVNVPTLTNRAARYRVTITCGVQENSESPVVTKTFMAFHDSALS